MDMCNVVHALKPILLMVLVQVANAWVNVLYKLALNDGMNLSIIVAYRYVFATAFIAPLAFIVERFFFALSLLLLLLLLAFWSWLGFTLWLFQC